VVAAFERVLPRMAELYVTLRSQPGTVRGGTDALM
jgi:hypothetical protein